MNKVNNKNILMVQIIQEELFHYLSLHENEVVIWTIMTSHIYQHRTAIP